MIQDSWTVADLDYEQVVQQLAEGRDPNDGDSNGWTALHRASWHGRGVIVEHLVKFMADVDQPTCDGSAALHLAVRGGHVEVVQLLVKAQADVNVCTLSRVRPLHEAVVRGQLEMIGVLLKAGAAVDCPHCEPEVGSPLFAAAAFGLHMEADLMMQAGADVNFCYLGEQQLHPDCDLPELDQFQVKKFDEETSRILSRGGATVIQVATMSCSPRIVQQLITRMAVMDQSDNLGYTALHTAVSLGNIEITSALIAAQTEINNQDESGWSPLHHAAHNGCSEIAAMLIAAGADMNLRQCSDRSPLLYAAQNGHVEIVKMLLSARADVDLCSDSGWSALHLAAINGHTHVTPSLLNAGCDIDLPEDGGFSPMCIAAQHGYTQLVKQFLENCASVDHRENAGGSAMQIAAQHGHPDVVSLLIQSGAEIDLREDIGWTALHCAAQHGKSQVAQALIESGCQIDITEYDGWTPLHVAALYGHAQVAEKLVAASADRSLLDKNGWSALHFAAALGNFDILLMLTHSSASDCASGPLKACRNSSRQFDSIALSTAMSKAGFNSTTATLQAAVGSALEDILRLRLGYFNYFVFGSFADGWGNCLTGIDGQIDLDSDIDITRIQDRSHLHIPGGRSNSTCAKDCVPVQYNDGHVDFPVKITRPNQVSEGSALCPAIDEITAYPCCGYPPIQLLQLGYRSHMSAALLTALDQQVRTSRCHVVSAAPPGREGGCMRVSTTHLEQTVMRHLSTVQGQLFILLKFFIKKVIAKQVTGLKTYHAKNLLFFMLDETPEDQWRPENLFLLVQQSLQILQKCLMEVTDNERQCMRHFFLRDAAVYLRGDHQPKNEIFNVVADIIDRLPELLLEFSQALRMQDKQLIRFHPFRIITSVHVGHSSVDHRCEYYEIFFAVERVLLDLAKDVPSFERQKAFRRMIKWIERIPDCARTAREGLRALTHLKFDRHIQFDDSFRSTVSKGIPCPDSNVNLNFEEAKKLAWHNLIHTDSAWKFCFMWNERPDFDFLPSHIREAFPCSAWVYTNYYYMNFDALMKTLQLEFCPSKISSEAVFHELLDADDTDPQELLMSLHYCQDDEQLVRIIHKHKDAIAVARLVDEVLAEYRARLGMLTACEHLVKEKTTMKLDLQYLHMA